MKHTKGKNRFIPHLHFVNVPTIMQHSDSFPHQWIKLFYRAPVNRGWWPFA
ncbi:hypothetical protein [Sulfurovum sp.]|uniref:hypothetical protein n=1 Tax=Sulfurovum sp. TaxID=1969726 RepID=UPI0025D3BC39|nr:hypothetical protein [Sulfurovum sp.]